MCKHLRMIENGRLLEQHIYRTKKQLIYVFFKCESEGSNPPADLEWFLKGKKIPNPQVTYYF